MYIVRGPEDLVPEDLVPMILIWSKIKAVSMNLDICPRLGRSQHSVQYN